MTGFCESFNDDSLNIFNYVVLRLIEKVDCKEGWFNTENEETAEYKY